VLTWVARVHGGGAEIDAAGSTSATAAWTSARLQRHPRQRLPAADQHAAEGRRLPRQPGRRYEAGSVRRIVPRRPTLYSVANNMVQDDLQQTTDGVWFVENSFCTDFWYMCHWHYI